MAYGIAQGVLGLDGVHQVQAYDTPPGPVMRGVHNYSASSWIKLDRIAGLYSLGEWEPLGAPASGMFGEVAYPSLTRGKTITYEGRIVGKTLNLMRQQIAAMRPFLMGIPGVVPVFPHERGPGKRAISIRITAPDDLGEGFTYDGRVMAFDLDDEQPYGPTRRPSPWMRSFILTMRQLDPRFYWDFLEQDDVPFNASAAATHTVTNLGNADTQHVGFTVFGPLDDLVIQNMTTGKKLEFENLAMTSTERVNIQFAVRAAAKPNQPLPDENPSTNMMGKLKSTTTDWWDPFAEGLAPGDNVLKLTSNHSSQNGRPHYKVSWQHASW